MNLTAHEQMLLEAIRCALRGDRVTWNRDVPDERWNALFKLAAAHKVLPMVYEAVCSCKAAQNTPVVTQYRRQVFTQVMIQTIKSEAALELYDYLQAQGLHPLIVKGAICRHIFPMPDHRLSGDEDLYVPTSDFSAFCNALEAYGMLPVKEEREDAPEISWSKPGSPLHIELHQYLFAPNSDAYGDLEHFFEDSIQNSSEYQVSPTHCIASLNPHDHMLYLILHAYKHFIHSGFGIRQVCDIGMWAQKYAQQIDWSRLYTQCSSANALYFSASVFKIVQKHLGISLSIPKMWYTVKIDCAPMLEDLLSAGIYGSATTSRLHSASVTLSEVEAQQHNGKNSLIATLFPKKESMAGKYPILNDHPYLLPVAWFVRIAKYGAETITSRSDNSAAESLRIAKERTKLLRYYQIIR